MRAMAVAAVCDCSTCLSGSLEVRMKVWGVSHARSSACRHLFVRPNRYVSKPSACQRVQSDHAGARFDPAAAAPMGRHSSIMVSPEDCGAGGLTKCLPLSLLLDGPVL